MLHGDCCSAGDVLCAFARGTGSEDHAYTVGLAVLTRGSSLVERVYGYADNLECFL